MLKSMTGYGHSSLDSELLSLSVEIKSLNSKFLDIGLKLPREFADKELEVRNLIGNTLERGKIMICVEADTKSEQKPKVSINRALVLAYYQDLVETARMVGASENDLFKIALEMPKAVNAEAENEEGEEQWKQILKALNEAIKKCEEFRLKEGKALELKLEEYIKKIEELLQKVTLADPSRTEAVRQKIRNHLTEFRVDEQIDQNRFEQELIYYIEKLDISEEKVRLKSHLEYFLETLKSKDANGKKLGFIAQEIGREINTIGSKANDAVIQRYVVEMKEELEKIKEQSMNVL